MSPKKGYKSVPWLFGKEIEIPEEWEVKKIEYLFRVGSSKRVMESQWKSKGVPFYRGREITSLSKYGKVKNKLFISEELYQEYAEEYGVPKVGDVLITGIGTVGNSYLVKTNEKFYFKDASVLWLSKISNLDSKFVSFWLQTRKFFQQLDKGNGSTVDSLTIKKLQSIKIWLPPIQKQQKIATILSNVDSLIESTRQVIENSKSLKTGLVQKLLTRGIGHTKFKKVPWLFGKEIEIPEEWEVKKLEEVGEIIGGGTPDSTNKDFWNGDILWAVPTDITKLQVNQIEDTERKITKLGLENSSAKLLPDETILITSRATIGECAITTKPITTNQGFQNIICNDKHNHYLIFYLIKHFPNNLLRLSQGTTFLEINKNQMKKVIVPISNDIKEQQKIVTILSNIDAQIDSQTQYKDKLERLKKSLMQKLLTGEVRVAI